MREKKQLKIYIHTELLKKFRIKCVEEDVNYSAAIQELMRIWLRESELK